MRTESLLKVGYVFKKNALVNESGRVPKQTCSQSAVRDVSTHDAGERALMMDISQDERRQSWRMKNKRKKSA